MRGVLPNLFKRRQLTKTHGHYENHYHISDVAVDAKLRQQKDRCAICNRAFADLNTTRRPHLDHDHRCCSTRPTCGKCNRGMLCASCNMILGIVERANVDFGFLFKAMIRYILKWRLIHQRQRSE